MLCTVPSLISLILCSLFQPYERLFHFNITVYCFSFAAIVMFVLECSITVAGLSGPLRVNCFGSRDIASVECSYDDRAIVEACEHVQLCIKAYDYAGHILSVLIAVPT